MEVLLSIVLFVIMGIIFVGAALVAGKFLRPSLPSREKGEPYECGEPSVGSSWVQFDLRFYIIALVYLIFDVEVALFYPWAVAWGAPPQDGMSIFQFRQIAIVDMLFFFSVLLVGFAYLWRFGYLDWVRSAATTSLKIAPPPNPA